MGSVDHMHVMGFDWGVPNTKGVIHTVLLFGLSLHLVHTKVVHCKVVVNHKILGSGHVFIDNLVNLI